MLSFPASFLLLVTVGARAGPDWGKTRYKAAKTYAGKLRDVMQHIYDSVVINRQITTISHKCMFFFSHNLNQLKGTVCSEYLDI